MKSNIPTVIIAAGGHAAEVATYMLLNGWNLIGAVDDFATPGKWHGTEILGRIDDLPNIVEQFGDVRYITAFGDNNVRSRMVSKLNALGLGERLSPVSVIHDSAWCGIGVEIGDGTLLAPNSLVTTRTSIGEHCILNIKASVSHDCKIGAFCNLNPGVTICGNVQIGDECYVGAGAIVKEKIRIGARATIGAGSVVIRDVPAGAIVAGVPARPIRTSVHEPKEPA